MQQEIKLTEHGQLSRIDKMGAAEAARTLLKTINAHGADSKYDLHGIKQLADKAVAGEIETPIESYPGRWEWREGLLPQAIGDAYAALLFYLQGLTSASEWDQRQIRADGAYVTIYTGNRG